MNSKWYTVRVATNKERFINDKINQEYSRRGEVISTLLPIEKNLSVKSGKRVLRDKIVYPGYIFVKSDNLETLQECLRLIPGNSGILKSRTGEPATLKQEEVDKMITDIQKSIETGLKDFTVGEVISITAGPFESFKATIEEINKEKSKIKVNVSIFGRKTPVDLNMDQIERIVD